MTMLEILYQKKKVRLRVVQLTAYKQMKIVETHGKNGHTYYLFCYKNHFINVKKTATVHLHSFLARALREGLTFSTDHVLTNIFLQSKTAYPLITNNQMVDKLKKQFSATERLYILAMFDNYIQPQKIQTLCKESFYQYRRNGQLKKAFQIVLHYYNALPSDSFANDMLQHTDFQKYKTLYADIEQLAASWSDPLYLENYIFDHHFPNSFIKPLFDQYGIEERSFDQILLYYCQHDSLQDKLSFDQLSFAAYADKIQVSFWSELLPSHRFTRKLMEQLLSLGAYDAILDYFLQTEEQPIELDLLDQAVPHISADFLAKRYQQILPLITSLYEDHHQLDQLLKHLVKKLLSSTELSDLLACIDHNELPTVQKLRKIKQLTDNPDQQFVLGEIYYELGQYDKAIACFEWEMELAPDDTSPIQYLYKSHLANGDKEKAQTYQQLLATLPSS